MVAQACLTLCDPHGLQPARLLRPWDSPGKDTRGGSQFLLQGLFLTQGLNLGIPHCRQIFYPDGSPSGRPSTLMTSFNPNHLPKAPYPKTNTGVVVFQHMNLHAARNLHLLSDRQVIKV